MGRKRCVLSGPYSSHQTDQVPFIPTVDPRVPVEVSTKNNVLETHLSSAFSPGRDACRETRDNVLVPTDFPVQYQSRGDIDYRGLDVAGELNVTDNTNYWESRSTLPSALASF